MKDYVEPGQYLRMAVPAAVQVAKLGLADEMFRVLAAQIREFQAGLAPDEEVGACLASFGQEITIHVTDLSYQNPYLMIFHGIAPHGKPVTLLQHVSQVNLLLMPVKADGAPRRLGFKPPEAAASADPPEAP